MAERLSIPIVPTQVRRTFVAAAAVVWLWFFWFASSNPPGTSPDWCGLDRNQLFGRGLIVVAPSLLLYLLALRLVEKRIRSTYLPPHGQAPWVTYASLSFIVLLCGLGWSTDACRILLPGFSCQVSTGALPIQPSPEPMALDRWPRIDWTENCRSVSGTWTDFVNGGIPNRYNAVSLRFHPAGRPDLPGWIHSRGSPEIVKEGSNETLPWTGKGVLQLIHNLSGKTITPEYEKWVLSYLDQYCTTWSSAGPVTTNPLMSGAVFSSNIHHTWTGKSPIGGWSQTYQDLRPRWFLPGLCALGWCLMTAGVYLVARATMGRPACDPA